MHLAALVPVIIILRASEPRDVNITARWNHVRAVAAEVDPADLPRIAADPNVERVDVDLPGGGSLVTSVPMIGGDVVRNAGYTAKGITVAILDGSGAAKDDHGHGTNVTGIIASVGKVSAAGVAPGVSIVAVKVLDRNNRFAGTAQILSGLNWMIDKHPEVRVINMSLGTDAVFPSHCDSSTASGIAFADAVRTLRSRGALVFVSAGNDGSSTSMELPACVQNVTSVGAVYDANFGAFAAFTCSTSNAMIDGVTCFTNSNATLDLLAPGTRIVSDGINGLTSTFTGTSQASPHVAGSAAVLFAIKPDATPDEIEDLLKRTGKPVLDTRNGVTIPRINLYEAASDLTRKPSDRRHRAAGHS